MNFSIAQLTCDLDRRRILSAIDALPKSVKEIARSCHMSLSRCYRMIKEMEEHGILMRADLEGREAVYVSNLHSVEMALEDDHIFFSVKFKDGTQEDMEIGPKDLEKRREHPVGHSLLRGADSREPSTVS